MKRTAKSLALPSAVFACALLVGPVLAAAEEQNPTYDFPGPYKAEVVRVIDGDTILVRVALWPSLTGEVAARVRGIDAPEIRGPGCEGELLLGQQAKRFVEFRYAPGDFVQLRDVGPDPFSGRVVADIRRWVSDRWRPLSDELLKAEPALAVEWLPTDDPVPWCLLAQP